MSLTAIGTVLSKTLTNIYSISRSKLVLRCSPDKSDFSVIVLP